MSEAVLAALVTGAFSLVGVVLSNRRAAKDMANKLALGQAVTEARIDELTREVRLHNGFAERIPVLEERLRAALERVARLEGRI